MQLIVQEGIHGRGVFAGEPIPAGMAILKYSGPYLRYAQTTPQTYAVQIGPDLYLGASGGMDDYVNHSCDPNAGLRIEGSSVTLVAIRDIREGEEIFFDYSTTMDEDDFELDCRCGSSLCRARIRDGKHLPAPTWERYVKLGIIPGYVRASRAKLESRGQRR